MINSAPCFPVGQPHHYPCARLPKSTAVGTKDATSHDLPKRTTEIGILIAFTPSPQRVLSEIEEHVAGSCILTTNTLTLPLRELASGLARPSQLVGMRFLAPVVLIPFIEITYDSTQGPEGVERARAIADELGHLLFVGPQAEDVAHVRTLGWRRLRLHHADVGVLQSREASARRTVWEGEAGDIAVRRVETVFSQYQEGNKECCICMERPADTVNMGCGHAVMCRECFAALRQRTQHARCPVCRAPMYEAPTLLQTPPVDSEEENLR